MKNRFLAITLSILVSGFVLTSIGRADLATWEFTGFIDRVPMDATDFQEGDTFTFRFTINYGTFGQVTYSPTPGDLSVYFPNALSDLELAFDHGLVWQSDRGGAVQTRSGHIAGPSYSAGDYDVSLANFAAPNPPFPFVLIPPDEFFHYNPHDDFSGGRLFISDSTSDETVWGRLTTIEKLAQFAVPEPSTYGAIGALLLLGLAAVRRARRS